MDLSWFTCSVQNTDFMRSPKGEPKSSTADIIYTIEDDDDIFNADSIKSAKNELASSTLKRSSEDSKYINYDTSADLICIVDDDDVIQNTDGMQSPRKDTKFTHISTVQNIDSVKSTSNESKYPDTDTYTDRICIVEDAGSLQNMTGVQSQKDDIKSTDISTAQITYAVKSMRDESKSKDIETTTDLICIMENDDTIQNTKSPKLNLTDSVTENDHFNQKALNLNSSTNESKSSDAKCTVEDDKDKISLILIYDSNDSIIIPKKHKNKWQKMYNCKFCMQTLLRQYQVRPHLETHQKLIESQKVHKIKHTYVPMVRIDEPKRRNSNCSETSVYLLHGFRVNNIFDNYFSSSQINTKASKDGKADKREKKYSKIKRISSSSSELEIVTDEPTAKLINVEKKTSVENSQDALTRQYYSEINTTGTYSIERINRSQSSSNFNNIETFKSEPADKPQLKYKKPSVENSQDLLTLQCYSETDATGKHSIKRINLLSSNSNSSDTGKFKNDPTDKPQSGANSKLVVINTLKNAILEKPSSSSYIEIEHASNLRNESQKLQSKHKFSSEIVKNIKHSIKRNPSSSTNIEMATCNPAAKRVHIEKSYKTGKLKPKPLNKLQLQIKFNPEKHSASKISSCENSHDASHSKPEMSTKVEHSAPKHGLDEHCLDTPFETSKHSASKVRPRENSQDTVHLKAKQNTEVFKNLQYAGIKLKFDEDQHCKPEKYSESEIGSAVIVQDLHLRRKSKQEINKKAETPEPKSRLDNNWIYIPESEVKSIKEINKRVKPSSTETKADPQSVKNNEQFKSNAKIDSAKLSVSAVTSAVNSQDTSQSKLKFKLKNKEDAHHSTLNKGSPGKSLCSSNENSNREIIKQTKVSILKVKKFEQYSENKLNPETIKQTEKSTPKKRSSEIFIDAALLKDTSNTEIIKEAEYSYLKKRFSEKILDVAQSKDKSNPEINKKAEPSPSKRRLSGKLLHIPQSKNKSNPESKTEAQQSTLKGKHSEKSRDAPISKVTSYPEMEKIADQSLLKIRSSEKLQDVQQSKDTSNPKIKAEQSPLKRRPSEKSLEVQSIDKSNSGINEDAEQTTLKRRTSENSLNPQQSKRRLDTEINKTAEQTILQRTTVEGSLKLPQSNNTSNLEINKNAKQSTLKRRISEKSQDLNLAQNLAHLVPISKDTSNPVINKNAEQPTLKRITSDKSLNSPHSEDTSISENNRKTEHSITNKSPEKSLYVVQNKTQSNPRRNEDGEDSVLYIKTQLPDKTPKLEIITDLEINKDVEHSLNASRLTYTINKMTGYLKVDETLVESVNEAMKKKQKPVINEESQSNKIVTQTPPNSNFNFRLPFHDIAESLLQLEQETSTSAVSQSVKEYPNTILDMPIIVSATPKLPPPEIISIGYSQLRTQQNSLEGTPQTTTYVPQEIISVGFSQPKTQQYQPEETPQNVIQISFVAPLNREIKTVGIVNKHLTVARGSVQQPLTNVSLLQPSRPIIKCKPASALLSFQKQPLKQPIKPFDRIIAELRDIGLTLHEDISLPDFRTLTLYDANVGWQKLKVSLYVSEKRYNFFCIQITDDRGRLAIRKESVGNQRQILESLRTQDIRKTIEKNAEALSIHVLYETARFMSTVTKIFQK